MNGKHAHNEIFEALAELLCVLPEMRAGQLMAAVGEVCADMHGHGLWDVTDEQLRQAIQRFRTNHETAMASGSQTLSQNK